MAYEEIINQWMNVNNVQTLWAQIVANFIHAAPAAKGDILFWNAASQGGQGNTPVQPSHLAIGSTGQLLGVANGVPAWVTPQIMQSGGSGSAALKIYLKDADGDNIKLTLQAADGTHWGIVTDQAQVFGGDKTFNGNVTGKKNIQAEWGVSAEGIADLAMSAGGGGGTVTTIAYGDVALANEYLPVNGKITLPKSADNITWTASNQSLTQDQKTGLLALYAKAPSTLWDEGNEVADKFFVNSSIQTATATYQGSYNLVTDLSLTISASRADIASALGSVISGEDNNDYAFVEIPTANDKPTEIARIERYKFNGTAWSYEYTLNNSGFTAAQWASINSGINSSLVGDIGTLKGFFNMSNGKALKAVEADKFSSARTIALTGNVTGSASSTGESGWSIAATIPADTVTNSMLVNKTIYINGTEFTLGDSAITNRLTQKWGTARDIQIKDADGTNEGVATSVDGSQAYKIALPKDIKLETLLSTEGITSEKNIEAGWGMSAGGICSLAMSAGGGGGTITGIQLGEGGPVYDEPQSGTLTLPAYPTFESLGLGSAATHDNEEYLAALGVTGDKIQLTQGGVAQTALTVPYATLSTDTRTELLTGQEFTYRQTAGGALTYKPSAAVIKRVLGNSVLWNQIIDTLVSTGYGTVTKSNGLFTYTKTREDNASPYILKTFSISGHSYYIRLDDVSKPDGARYYSTMRGGYSELSTKRGYIEEATASAGLLIDMRQCSQNAIWTFYVKAIDLTLFFNGSIPTGLTAETFERDYGYLLANPEYNAGTVINNAAKGLETVGFNLFDETYQSGKAIGQSGGQYVINNESNSWVSAPIKVIGGNTYYKKGGGYMAYLLTDTNNRYITGGGINTPNNLINLTNLPVQEYLLYISVYNEGTRPAYNICINLSDPSKNDTYEPYKKNVLPLNLNSFKVKDAQGNIVTINGLKKAGSVYDEIVGKKFIQRVGKKEFKGSENGWTLQSINSYNIANFQLSILDNKGSRNNICNLFQKQTSLISVTQTEGYMFGGTNEKQFFIRINSSKASTVTEFKTWLSSNNVELNYELATPVEYEIIDDFPTTYPIDVLGTERIVSDELVAPFVADIQYGAEQRDTAWDIDHLASKLADMDISHYSSLNDAVDDVHVIKIRGKKFYLKFRATQADATTTPQTLPAFELAVADNADGNNEQVFAFGTITEDWITEHCVLPTT